MIVAYLLLGGMLLALALTARRRPGDFHRTALRLAWSQLAPLLVRLPVALVAASLLAEVLPMDAFVAVLGEGSGFAGVLAASLLGAVLPGGPMVSFPLAMVLFRAGAGTPQMVALLTAWSVLAVHRVLIFELPMLGWSFVWQRWLASLVLAPLAGALALALVP